MRDVLALLQRCGIVKSNVMTQWHLVHVGLNCLRYRGNPSEAWVRSFRATNLDPRFRMQFPAWCKVIAEFLQAGSRFEEEDEPDKLAMLPPWWRVWGAEKQEAAIALVAKHKQQWTVELVKEAHDQLDVPMRSMQDLRLCVVVVTEARVPTAALPPCPVALASVPKANPTRNLLAFTFRPEGMKGKELFAHMCKLRNRAAPSTGVDVSPRAGDIEITDTQRSITDLLLGSIVRESALTGENRKLPQRRLNAVGEINNRCVIGNSEDRSRKLEEAMMLGKSLGIQIEQGRG
jgi:hypothetical protein